MKTETNDSYYATPFTHIYEDGTQVWSAELMSAQELVEHKLMVDEMSASYVELDEDDYEPYYTLGEPRMSW